MSTPNDIEQFDAYLLGEMTLETREQFEQRLRDDAELSKAFSAHRLIAEAIVNSGVRADELLTQAMLNLNDKQMRDITTQARSDAEASHTAADEEFIPPIAAAMQQPAPTKRKRFAWVAAIAATLVAAVAAFAVFNISREMSEDAPLIAEESAPKAKQVREVAAEEPDMMADMATDTIDAATEMPEVNYNDIALSNALLALENGMPEKAIPTLADCYAKTKDKEIGLKLIKAYEMARENGNANNIAADLRKRYKDDAALMQQVDRLVN